MRKTIAIAALAALTACGGGGGSSPSSPPSVPTSAPTSAPSIPTAAFTFSFPAGQQSSSSRRAPQYISPNTTQMQVVITKIDGVNAPSGAPYDTTTALSVGTNCTLAGGTETCTIQIPAPPGSINYTFNAKDSSNNLLSTVSVLLTMVKGQANTFAAGTVTLKGVVSTVTVSGATLVANTAIAAGETLTVGALDASGATIVNGTTSANYNNPITLTDNDPTGATKLTVNGGAAASSVVVNNPADVVKLTYTGQAANDFTITATGTGITGGGTISTTVQDITFTGGLDVLVDDTAHGGVSADPNYNAMTVFFYQASGTQSITGAELGFTNAPYSKQFDLTLSGGCASIATASASPATTFTITAAGAVGVCSARMTEHGTGYPITQHPAATHGVATQDGTFYISVTASNVGVNADRRHQ